MWVDLFSEVRENADGLKVLSDKDQKKLVFTLQAFICELPDLDSINESDFNLQSSILGQGNQLEIQDLKSEFVNLLDNLDNLMGSAQGVPKNKVSHSSSVPMHIRNRRTQDQLDLSDELPLEESKRNLERDSMLALDLIDINSDRIEAMIKN